MNRLLIVAPGRGSYNREELGSIQRWGYPSSRALLEEADEIRRAAGRIAITELDSAEKYQARLHQAGENASALTATLSAMDFEELVQADRGRIVGVTGNSLGWYTSLYTSGALSFGDALRVVEHMGSRQAGKIVGGQAIYPISDEEWRIDDEAERRIDSALQELCRQGDEFFVTRSIRLGGFVVFGGTEAGLKRLMSALPPIQIGERSYPFQLAFHSAFHTALMIEAAKDGLEFAKSGQLRWRPLNSTAVDGRGFQWLPFGSADPTSLADYTFRRQVLETYDFTRALRIALRELQPDRVVLLGPGSTLGSSIAQVMISEGWRGIRSRADFLAAQKNSNRPLVALGREDQRKDFFA